MLEKELGKKFGDDKNPLLVSVRSGAAASMPGMMNTILNLGLNDEVGRRPGQRDRQRAVRLRRLSPLINMFGDVVMGVDHEHFEAGVRQDQERSTRPSSTPMCRPKA